VAPGGPPDPGQVRAQDTQQAPPQRQGPQRSERRIADPTDRRRRPFVAIDMEFFCGSRKEHDLYERWGWCGVTLWAAFMSACKRAPLEGRVRFESEEHMAANLGVVGRELLDADGKPFTFREFFAWTGVRHWTRMVTRGTWPAVEWLGYDEHNRRRERRPPTPPAQPEEPPAEEAEEGPPMHDLGTTSASPTHDLAEKPRSEQRNARPDRTGQDRNTTEGGAVLPPESNDAAAPRTPTAARAGRAGPDQPHPDHEVGDPCRVLCQAHSNCARDCFACQQQRETA
jgi:hypothetical protein